MAVGCRPPSASARMKARSASAVLGPGLGLEVSDIVRLPTGRAAPAWRSGPVLASQAVAGASGGAALRRQGTFRPFSQRPMKLRRISSS